MTTLEHYQQLITDSGLTDYAIAQRSGLSANTVAAIRRGDGNPTVGTLELVRIAIESARHAT